ncbi:hypothetical protein HID58_015708 [Brassica napus]|uniref:Membrane insertase YidC/Oxa/ALB C-terminal domain-containing protein n=1 Tax=Brassica napus TaxID=3708 RepID=A0ABQ8DKV4_BRANA|nr:hypothetical protein HID58_015708 [Brassica napus]
MARVLISSPSSFFGSPLLKPSSSSRHVAGGGGGSLQFRNKHLVRFSLNELPPLHGSVDIGAILTRAESLLYTVADAAVVGGAADSAVSTDPAVQKSGGWFGFISDGMELVLKFLKDGLTAVHVPYAYGFAIILLTIIERIQLETSRLYKQAGVNPLAGCLPTLATIPVWIGLYQALSNVANEGLFTEGFFWIPSLGGPTSIAARQSGSGVSWLFPFVDGHPPLGWGDTAAYLVLPVLLIVSQYVSMEIMKPPQTDDPAQKNTLLVFKFLPLMIGYFALSVPSGLSIYWFTNNVLSTAQQVWLRKLGGAAPAVNENASGIITAGRAKRSIAQPDDAGERFRQLKEQEKRSKKNKAVAKDTVELLDESEEGSDDEEEEVREGALASSTSKPLPDVGQRRSKRSKRKRAV